MKTIFACKHCGRVEVVESDYIKKDELKVVNTCSHCHDAAVVDAVLGCKELKKVINELNAYEFELCDDGELLELGQKYAFKFKVDGKRIKIWDANEYFNIDLDEEIRCIVHSAAREFGFEYSTPESTVDRIKGQLEAALRKDFKDNELYLDWQDSVVMVAYAN